MKGVTNNPNGRPKGRPNKSTKNLKETVMAFLANNMGSRCTTRLQKLTEFY